MIDQLKATGNLLILLTFVPLYTRSVPIKLAPRNLTVTWITEARMGRGGCNDSDNHSSEKIIDSEHAGVRAAGRLHAGIGADALRLCRCAGVASHLSIGFGQYAASAMLE